MPMGHAWVEVGSTVYDNSNGRKIKISKSKYYHSGAIDGLLKKGYKQHRYKGIEVAEMVLKNKHWGPWENLGVNRQEIIMGYNPFDFLGKDKKKSISSKVMGLAHDVVTEHKLREMIREILKEK